MPGKSATDDLLTTGQCAKIAHCARRTVAGWIDGGRLKGFRLPDSQDRRVHRAVLLDFLRDNGYPVNGDGVLGTNPPVLVLGQPAHVVDGLAAAFAASGVGVVAHPADTAVDWLRFGILYRDYRPCAVVLDDGCGLDVVRAIPAVLSAAERQPFVVLFRDPSAELVMIPGVRVLFHTPADPVEVARIVMRGR